MTGSITLLREKHYIYKICLMMVLAFFVLGTSPARALTINDIRFGLHTDSTRMVLEISEFAKFRAFVLDDPYRLVIDLPAYHWNVQKISKPSTSGVKAIRQGNLQPGISRIVVDLDQPMLIKNAFLLRANAGAPDRLVIDFAKTTAANFAEGKNRIHGILDVSDNTSSSTSSNNTSTRTHTASNANPPAPPIPPKATQQRPLVKSASSGMAMPGYKPQTSGGYTRAPVPPALAGKPLIIIDAGHGGVDPGAIGSNGVFEKHITLAAARELQQALNATGRYRAELTRSTDKYLKLYQRVAIARKKKADLFISLHADTVGKAKSSVTGASIYTLSEKASDAQTEKLAARENKADLIAGVDLSTEDEEVANILVDLTMRDTMNQSKFFANTVVNEMSSNGLKTLERPHRYAGFAVLKAPDIPSVLIELGFLSNRNEAQRLSTPSYRSKIIAALIEGIDGYFEKIRLNQKT